MTKFKNIVKCSLLSLLSLTLVMNGVDMSAFAAEKEIVEISPQT